MSRKGGNTSSLLCDFGLMTATQTEEQPQRLRGRFGEDYSRTDDGGQKEERRTLGECRCVRE